MVWPLLAASSSDSKADRKRLLDARLGLNNVHSGPAASRCRTPHNNENKKQKVDNNPIALLIIAYTMMNCPKVSSAAMEGVVGKEGQGNNLRKRKKRSRPLVISDLSDDLIGKFLKVFHLSWTRSFSVYCWNLPSVLSGLRNDVRK